MWVAAGAIATATSMRCCVFCCKLTWAGGRNATVDKEIGGKSSRPLLEQIRGQSARGESQHGGWGSMQRWSTRPVPMIAA